MEIKLKEAGGMGSAIARHTSTEELSGALNCDNSLDAGTEDSKPRDNILLAELNRLRQENERLHTENEEMRRIYGNSTEAKVL